MTGELPKGHRVPVPAAIQANGQRLGDLVGKSLPPGWGFGLFLFTFGPDGTMFWISNAQRGDMAKALSEWIHTEGS